MSTLILTIEGRDKLSAVINDAIKGINTLGRSSTRLDKLNQSALNLRETFQGDFANSFIGKLTEDISRLSDTTKGLKLGDIGKGGRLSSRLSKISTNADKASTSFENLQDRSDKLDVSMDKLAVSTGKVADQLRVVANASKTIKAPRALPKLVENTEKANERLKETEERLKGAEGAAGKTKGYERLRKEVDGLRDAAAGFKEEFGGIAGSGLSRDLDQIGRDIEKVTDGFDKTRNAVDATSDTLRIFGRRGRAMADAIEDNIEDPAERAQFALKTLRKELNRTPNTVDKLNKAYGRNKAQLDLMVASLGPVGSIAGGAFLAGGAAAIGMAAVVGGALLGAIKDVTTEAIKGNKEMQKAAKGTEAAYSDLKQSLGQALLGGSSEGANSLANLTLILDRLTESVENNADTIRSGWVFAVDAAELAAVALGASIISTTLPFTVFADVINAASSPIRVLTGDIEAFGLTLSTLRAYGNSGRLAGDVADSLTEPVSNAETRIAKTRRSIAELEREFEKSESRRAKFKPATSTEQRSSGIGDALKTQQKDLEKADRFIAKLRKQAEAVASLRIEGVDNSVTLDNLAQEVAKREEEKEKIIQSNSALQERYDILSRFDSLNIDSTLNIDTRDKNADALYDLASKTFEDARRLDELARQLRQEADTASTRRLSILQSEIQKTEELARAKHQLNGELQVEAQNKRKEEEFEHKRKKARQNQEQYTQRILAAVRKEAQQRIQFSTDIQDANASEVKSRVDGFNALQRSNREHLKSLRERLEVEKNASTRGALTAEIRELTVSSLNASVAIRTLTDEYKKLKGEEDAEKADKKRAQGVQNLVSTLRQQARDDLEINALLDSGSASQLEGKAASITQKIEELKRVRAGLDDAIRSAVAGSEESKALGTQKNDLNTEIDGLQSNVDRINAQIANADPFSQWVDGFSKASEASANFSEEFGQQSANLLQGSIADLAGGIGSALGQGLGKGGGSFLKETGKLVAGIAGQWGDLFIAQGAGLIFTNPAAGLGLIGAGVAIKALSSRLASGSSGGSRGGSSSSSVARATGRFSSSIERNNNQNNENRPVYLTLPDGRVVQGYMRNSRQDDQRRGRNGE